MLDFFSIFSKGGIVLWCFQGVSGSVSGTVNALIRSVILQGLLVRMWITRWNGLPGAVVEARSIFGFERTWERGGTSSFTHEALTLKYKLDNEFELLFVVGYQKILTLTYVDKFIDDIHMQFRDKYRNQLQQHGVLGHISGSFDFSDDFRMLLRAAEERTKAKAPSAMKTFEQSDKSRKTVKSLIEVRGGEKKENKKNKKEALVPEPAPVPKAVEIPLKAIAAGDANQNGLTQDEIILRNREELSKKLKRKEKKETSSKSPKPRKPKQDRKWSLDQKASAKGLDYSPSLVNGQSTVSNSGDNSSSNMSKHLESMKGNLKDVDHDSSDSEEQEEEEHSVIQEVSKTSEKRAGFGGMLGMLKGLVGSKSLTPQDMEPVLEKMKDHLIAKNVAADIAVQLCESVAKKLEGKVMGTFSTVTSTVKQALQDSLVQILQPKRRVDILRDVIEAQKQRRPFIITFCGVNGVGKSTNLAKISFWLMENGFRVLIAACDTFRAGAVEQLRTHAHRLNSLHPPEKNNGQPMVQLFERGYGKDAAGIAMEAIAFARNHEFDVVLVDTAGRMQDNTPLMTALAKLIAINMPDLVLFVGEALVGNEAVDQLVKFNQALADHSMIEKPQLIDGIVLTKFDTIDDKVGAAISMTYITGQPIVFVGTGQTYNDLRSLNAKAIVSALIKA
ncbi:signal recognition particle receptor subunit alpha isoform X1 [Callorhinchus milii]|uniref:signal recognition particle receptor subunit alpha isoform X1 n=1 Tax=Callorhinchus milii TaxID=7868 RepID=UPI0004575323|nr:signal recognition particle receptor subunit alpha isoform X1 [Callorhinchus milii]|eukprot:gi/632956859/ref/XP_007894166.1/ PREDICTED: signal recognition particle receptor subunit alpha isoform X1 [Callorhinchus milii]